LALALAAGVRQPFVLSIIIVFSSAAGAMGQPAYSAMLPDLVPPEELMALVTLGIYSWNGGRILGPLLGTVLVTVVGPAWTVAFNAITFAAMALAVALVRRPFLPQLTAAEGIRARLHEGWRALKRAPGCRYGIAMILVLNLAVGPFMGLIPIYARQVFGGGTALAGALSALQGVGAIIGGLAFLALAARYGRARMLVAVGTVMVAMYAVYALAPSRLVAGFAILWMGAGSASIFACSMAIIQRDAPDGERGRILSITQCGMGLFYGLGVLWISVLGDATSLRVAFLAAAVVATTAATLLTRQAPDWRDVIDDDQAVLANAPVPATA
jgi:MFS family permease